MIALDRHAIGGNRALFGLVPVEIAALDQRTGTLFPLQDKGEVWLVMRKVFGSRTGSVKVWDTDINEN